MKTIFFTNRERIMIGDNPIEYMTYLQKKLPAANYTDEREDELYIEENTAAKTPQRALQKPGSG